MLPFFFPPISHLFVLTPHPVHSHPHQMFVAISATSYFSNDTSLKLQSLITLMCQVLDCQKQEDVEKPDLRQERANPQAWTNVCISEPLSCVAVVRQFFMNSDISKSFVGNPKFGYLWQHVRCFNQEANSCWPYLVPLEMVHLSY